MGLVFAFKALVNVGGRFLADMPGNILGDWLSDVFQVKKTDYLNKCTSNRVAHNYAKNLDDGCLQLIGSIADDFVDKRIKDDKKLVVEFFKKMIASSESLNDEEYIASLLEGSKKYQKLYDWEQQFVKETFYDLRKSLREEEFKTLTHNEKVLYNCITAACDPRKFLKEIAEEMKTQSTDAQVAAVVKEKYSFTYVRHECPDCENKKYIKYDYKIKRLRCESCGTSFTLEQNWENHLTKDYFDNALKAMEARLGDTIVNDGDKTRRVVTEQGKNITDVVIEQGNNITGMIGGLRDDMKVMIGANLPITQISKYCGKCFGANEKSAEVCIGCHRCTTFYPTLDEAKKAKKRKKLIITSVIALALIISVAITCILMYPRGLNPLGLKYDYSIDDGGYEVSSGIGWIVNRQTEMIIPEDFEGAPVVRIADEAFKGNYSIKSVTVPNTVKAIGVNAFNDCLYLESVTLGSKVAYIGDGAFSDCPVLEAVILPRSIQGIGVNAFDKCDSLKSIVYNGTVAEWNAIKRTKGWNNGMITNEIICSDGTAVMYSVDWALDGGVMDIELPFEYVGSIGISSSDIPAPKFETYPEYNYFLGWYKDAAFSEEFDFNLTAAPKNTTVYAKWDKCASYNGVGVTPDSVTGERVVIDWRDSDIQGKAVTVKNSVKEITFIGAVGKEYTNTAIILNGFANGQKISVELKNFSYCGYADINALAQGAMITVNSEGVELDLVLDGASSVRSTAKSGAGVFTYGVINVLGNGSLKVRGGDGDSENSATLVGGCGLNALTLNITGAVNVEILGGTGANAKNVTSNGSKGGVGVKVQNININNAEASVSIKGGAGGRGCDGTTVSIDYDGGALDVPNAGHGTDGGFGGEAVNGKLTVYSAENVMIIGGDGGDGGDGGNVEGEGSYDDCAKLPSGGDGGGGGGGGKPITATDIEIISCPMLTLFYGDGGDGGAGGNGGDSHEMDKWIPDDGGNGGNGGNGGYGHNSGSGGKGGNGGYSFGRSGGFLNSEHYQGRSGDGGDGGDSGSRVVGVLYCSGEITAVYGNAGDVGSEGDAGKIDNDSYKGSEGDEGNPGNTISESNYYYKQVRNHFNGV